MFGNHLRCRSFFYGSYPLPSRRPSRAMQLTGAALPGTTHHLPAQHQSSAAQKERSAIMTKPTSTHAYEIEETGGHAVFRVLRHLPGSLNASATGKEDITRIPAEKWTVIKQHLLAYLSVQHPGRRQSRVSSFIPLNVTEGQACETFFLITAAIKDASELDTAATNWFSKAITAGKPVEIGSINLAANQTRLVGWRVERTGIADSVGIARLPSASTDLFLDLPRRFGPAGTFELAAPGRKTKVRWAWIRTGLGTTVGLMPHQAASDPSGAGVEFVISSADVAIHCQASLGIARQIEAVRQTVQAMDEKIDEVIRPDFLALVRELDRELSIIQLRKIHLLPKQLRRR